LNCDKMPLNYTLKVAFPDKRIHALRARHNRLKKFA
ncbi:uncharacterized protein METZ01_LOCUS387029, partial [marine metagenome]